MAKISQSYLRKLKFDPKLLTTFRAKYLTNIRIVILAILLIVVAGVTSYISLPRRLNPEVKIPIVTVFTNLAGASSADVESLITIPLEEAINGVENISTVSSASQESVSAVTIEFNSGTDSEKAKTDVQSAVDTVQDLAEDATTPQVRIFDFEDQAVLTFAVTTRADLASLQRFSEILRDRLEELSRVDRVQITGLLSQEIQILMSPEKITTHAINPLTLSRSVQSAANSYPGGNVNTMSSSFGIGIDAPLDSIESLRKTIVTLNNQQIQLGDIAEISERPKPNQLTSYLADAKTPPRQVVTFSVFKTKTATINEAEHDIEKEVEETRAEFGNLATFVHVQNVGREIEDQFDELLTNFRETIILVFLTFLVFMGVRQAFIASLTIPLTFLASFTIMRFTGLSLNFLSLFSLLLTLGLLVDDTIVIVTGMTAYFRTRKFTPTQTGLLVWRDFITPIWSTTITTVWAFLPLLIATGIIGEFIKTIPIVVAATLYSSTAIAVLITIPLMMRALKLQIPFRVVLLIRIVAIILLVTLLYFLIPKNALLPLIIFVFILFVFISYRVRKSISDRITQVIRTRGNPRFTWRALWIRFDEGIVHFEPIATRYRNLLNRILASRAARRKVIIGIIIFCLFSYLLLPLGFVVNEFFPKSATEILYMTIEFPTGTNLATTDRVTQEIVEDARKTPGVRYLNAEEGRGVETTGRGFSSGDNLALIIFVLPKVDDQEIDSRDIARDLRNKFASYPKAKISVFEPSGGPPAGADFQIEISGEELAKLDAYADKVITFLKNQPGVVNADKSIKPGTGKLTFIPNNVEIARANLGIDAVGLWLRMFNSGLTFDKVKFREDQTQDITFRMKSENQLVEDITRLSIPTAAGNVPISSLGEFQLKASPTKITRTDGKRTITVTAGVNPGYSVSQTNQKLEEFARAKLALEQGYSWKTGGVNEENEKSVQSIFQAMIISAILILSTMVIQFRSYRQAILTMLVIPIAVAGVFVVFAITGTPLSFPALIGTLSLFGIVVTHAMILVDKINLNRRAGLPFREAIVDAGGARLEPIFLGSLVTIIGLIPISLSNPLWRGLGGAIIAGLSFSGIIMLVFIPTVYYMWFGKEGRRKS